MYKTEAYAGELANVRTMLSRGIISVSALARVNGISRKHVRNLIGGRIRKSSINLSRFIESAQLLSHGNPEENVFSQKATRMDTQALGHLTEDTFSSNDRPFVRKIIFLASLPVTIPDYPSFLEYMFNPEETKRVHRLVNRLVSDNLLEIHDDCLVPGPISFQVELTRNQRSYYLNAAVSYLLYIRRDYPRALGILLQDGRPVDREYCIIQIIKSQYEQYHIEQMYRSIVMYRHHIQSRGFRTSRALNMFLHSAFIRYYHEKRNYSSVVVLAMPFLGKTGIHTSSRHHRFNPDFDVRKLHSYDERFGPGFHDVSTYIKKALHAIITAYVQVDQFSLARELATFCLDHFSPEDPGYPDLYLFNFLIYRNYGSIADLEAMIETIERDCPASIANNLSYLIYRFYHDCYRKNHDGLKKLLPRIHRLCREKPDLLFHTVFMNAYIQYMIIYGKYGRALILIMNSLVSIPKNYRYQPMLYGEILEILSRKDPSFAMQSLAELADELTNDPFSDTFPFLKARRLWEQMYLFLCEIRDCSLPSPEEFGTMTVEEFFACFMKKINLTTATCKTEAEGIQKSGIPRRPPSQKAELDDTGKDWFIYDLYLTSHFNRAYRLRSIPTNLVDLKPYLKEFDYIPVFHFLGMHTFLDQYRNTLDKPAFLKDFQQRLAVEKQRILQDTPPPAGKTPVTEDGAFHLIDLDLKTCFLPYYLLKLLES